MLAQISRRMSMRACMAGVRRYHLATCVDALIGTPCSRTSHRVPAVELRQCVFDGILSRGCVPSSTNSQALRGHANGSGGPAANPAYLHRAHILPAVIGALTLVPVEVRPVVMDDAAIVHRLGLDAKGRRAGVRRRDRPAGPMHTPQAVLRSCAARALARQGPGGEASRQSGESEQGGGGHLPVYRYDRNEKTALSRQRKKIKKDSAGKTKAPWRRMSA